MSTRKLKINGVAESGASMTVSVDNVVVFDGIINDSDLANGVLAIVDVACGDARIEEQKNIKIEAKSSLGIGLIQSNLVPNTDPAPSVGADVFDDGADSRANITINGQAPNEDYSSNINNGADAWVYRIEANDVFAASIAIHALILTPEYSYETYAADYLS